MDQKQKEQQADKEARIRELERENARLIRQADEQYRLLFESAYDAILISGPDDLILDANPAAAVMLGYPSVAEMIGVPVGVHFHDSALHDDLFGELNKKGYLRNMQTTLMKQDGSGELVYALGSTVVHKDEAGEILRVESILSDITERVLAESALAERVHELELLNQIIVVGAEANDLATFFENGLKIVLEYLDYDAGAIHLVDETEEVAELQFSQNMPDQADEAGQLFSIREPPFAEVYVNGRPYLYENFSQTGLESMRLSGILSMAIQPIIWLNKVVGSMTFTSHKRELFSDHEKKVLQMIGKQMGSIVARLLAEDALRKSQLQYQMVSELTTDFAGAFVVEPDNSLRAEWVTEALTRITGYEIDELISRGGIVSLVHPDDQNEALADWDKLVANGSIVNAYRIITKEGQIRWLRNYGRIELNEENLPTRYLTAAQDITERKQAEEALRRSEERLRLAVETAQMATWEWNAHTDQMESFGYPIINPGPNNFEEFIQYIHPQDRHLLQTATQQTIDDDKPYRVEYRLRDANNNLRWVAARGRLYRDEQGQPDKLIGVAQDITVRKRAEEKLRRYAEDLERSNEELQKFAFIASHDLQEPLRKIQIFGDLLQRKYYSELDDRGQYYLGRLYKLAAHMQKMLTDYLEFSQVAIGATQFDHVELTAVLQEVARFLKPQIEAAQATLVLGDLPAIEADKAQMFQLFMNLLDNALKFQRPGEKPIVSVQGQLLLHESICQIIITDNGIGFDEKYVGRIFTVFQQLHGRGEYAGTGIGLAVCRKIVETHRGKIRAQSEHDQGATFIVSLPILQKH